MSDVNFDNITNIIVTGKSGAGKQPRIDVLVKEFGLEQLSTGDIFRNYLRKFNEFGYDNDLERFWNGKDHRFISDDKIVNEIGTKDYDIILGLKAKYFLDKGLFVPDYITNELFGSFFKKKNCINQVLDGYPRTTIQSIFLLDLLKKYNSKIDFIVLVDNSDERIIKRTIQRRICINCGKVYHLKYKPPINGYCECGGKIIQRSDDTEKKILSRLFEFKSKTIPAIKYLKENGIPIVKVPGHIEKFTFENIRNSIINELKNLY